MVPEKQEKASQFKPFSTLKKTNMFKRTLVAPAEAGCHKLRHQDRWTYKQQRRYPHVATCLHWGHETNGNYFLNVNQREPQ